MTARWTTASIYPNYCFSASPTFNTWAKLTAADVHALHDHPDYEGQHVYFYSNHPIKFVRLVGVLLGFDDITNAKWGFMDLDDGSGATIEIKWAKPPPVPAPGFNNNDGLSNAQIGSKNAIADKQAGVEAVTSVIKNSDGECIDMSGVDLGSVVKVKGTIDSFRGVRQIVLERINLVRSTNDEALAWDELTAFRTSILARPWYLSLEQEKQLLLASTEAAKRGEERKRLKEEKKKKREIERERKRALKKGKDNKPSDERYSKRSKGRNKGRDARKKHRSMQ